jgi:hypothetical protein
MRVDYLPRGFMRRFVSAALASVVWASPALAARATPFFAPGGPAGVKNAQMTDNTLVMVAGLGLVAAGIAIAASSGNSHTATTTSTSTTAP